MAGLGAFGGANLAGSFGAAGAQQGLEAAKVAGADLTSQTGALASENARDALLARSAETLPASVQGLPVPDFAGNAAQAGQGFKDVLSSGPARLDARNAFLNNAGGYSGLATDIGMAAAPALLAPPEPYKPPEAEKSNYAGPYTPTERQLRYPTEEERRRLGSSEFTYFTPSNPVPYAEGGKIDEDRSIKMPNFAAMSASSPEFNYGFKPVEITKPSVASASTPSGRTGGASGTISNFLRKIFEEKGGSNYTDLSKYEYDPRTQRLVSSSGGLPALARGGSVPQLENGGFVLTKKAVDGLGGGSNKKGQDNARRGLGAIPIKGPGTGTSDSIKTNIDGKRPALVSNGEAYVPKKQVAKKGGAKAFYALMNKAEKAADRRKRT
jgi:hypothetical protein